jgi:polyether ionophore transport system permease protein
MATVNALARLRFAGGRIRDLSFAFFFFVYAWGQTAAYDSTYPSAQDRLQFARSFSDNKALRLFYGVPHDLLTAGGYAAWRVGGTLAIFTAAWGLLAAVKSMRAEEDARREELVLSGAVGRRTSFAASTLAGAAGALLLAAAVWLGLLAANQNAGESALLATALAGAGTVFFGVGALVSQLASTRRLALELGAGVLAVAFVLRVVADTSESLDWLRWLTPLGWAEEVRPFTGSHPAVFLLLAGATAGLIAAARWIEARRDIGDGLLHSSDSREPNLGLLSSPLAQALRDEWGRLAVWVIGSGAFGAITGLLASSVTNVNVSQSLNEQLGKLGSGSITTASGYIAFTFLFFILIVCLFGSSQISAARHVEAEEQLETLFAQPVSRQRWLFGRLLLAGAGAAVLALVVGLSTWAGAAAAGADISLGDMIGAAANCLPIALLFLSLGALAFAIVPRASTGVAYGLVLVAFVWQLFGSLLDLPSWAVNLTPFHQVALVPAQSFKAGAALVMLAIAGLAMVAAVRVFERRDLVGT